VLTLLSTARATGAFSATLLAGLVTLPLAFDPHTRSPLENQQPDAAVLRGRVTSKNGGVPLVGARVRVAVPAADMRFIDVSKPHLVVEAKSDGDGRYRLEIPGLSGPTKISIDAMMPGFRRLVGTLMAGGDPRDIGVAPGKEAEADIALVTARYYHGIVVDDRGEPIAAAQVAANLSIGNSSGGVERTATGPDGSFEIFNYPIEFQAFGGQPSRGRIFFSHPAHISAKIEDVDAIEPGTLTSLRVVLPTGVKLTGILLDASGKPASGAMVEASLTDRSDRRATVTGADGSFALLGLKKGPTLVVASALTIKQKASLSIGLDADKVGLEVRLRALDLPAGLKKHDVLGMQLADLTPGLRSAYDLYQDRGALILDPGNDYERLKIGELAEGNLFWMVGNQRVGSVREFVSQVLAETAGRDVETYSVRVVYSFRSPEFVGTNTQYMQLTKDDIKRLQAMSDALAAEPR
jgi:Carboxypeptidase regulatory-like domain